MGEALCPGGQQLGMQMACAFYILGKVARLISTPQGGHAEDSMYDIMIYATMMQKIRATGTWL